MKKYVTHIFHAPPPSFEEWSDVFFITEVGCQYFLDLSPVTTVAQREIRSGLRSGKILAIRPRVLIYENETVRISNDGRIWIAKTDARFQEENRRIIGFSPELMEVMKHLSPAVRPRMEYYLGFKDRKEHGSGEAAEKFKCSRSIFNSALNKIKRMIRHVRYP